jgi:hypothetical protein
MGKIFLDVCHMGALKIALKIIVVVDLKDTSSLSRGPRKLCHKRETEIFCNVVVMQVKVDPRAGMGYAPHVEKCGLFDLLICIKVCLQTGKDPLAQCGEELGVVKGRVEDRGGPLYQFPFTQGIIMEIRFYPKGKNLRNPLQSAA